MTLFLASSVLLTLVALAFVVLPLLRGRAALQDQRRQINKAIYEQRLAEIEAECKTGRLDEVQAQAQRDEAGRALLNDLEASTARQLGGASHTHWPAMLAVLLILPAIALTVYLQGDSWRLIGSSEDAPAWDYVLNRLEAHLAENPDDLKSLLTLARTRRAAGDMSGALEAYAQLNTATGYANAEHLADEAETRILLAEGAFSDLAKERLSQTLAANPDDGRGLWYSGLSALQQGNNALAIQHWQRLSQQTLPDAFRKVLSQQLARLGSDVAGSPAAAAQTAIELRINSDPALIKGLAPDTPVFVMARPTDGSRAMLAVRKHRLDELPLTTQLTDGMNMAGGPQLSDYAQWRVVVRVAPSGDALPRSGDPYVEREVTMAETGKPLDLTINQRWR